MDPKLFTSTKRFANFPCTHRQWRAASHCRFVHGYAREFYFEFAASSLSDEGWVMDFGGLKAVKAWLDDWFDHTFLVAADDPQLPQFEQLANDGVLQLRVMPNPGMEGTAQFVWEKVQKIVNDLTQGRVKVTRVEVRENSNNSAIYTAKP